MKEICFNLWYYLDSQQYIRAIAARSYLLEGDDERKGQLLRENSGDYRSVIPTKIAPVHYSMLQQLGVETVFAPEFQKIARELPRGVVMPADKLYYATPLFDFGEGYAPARISNGFITDRD